MLAFDTQEGTLHLTLLGHGSLMLEFNGKVIYIDPYSQVADFSQLPAANQIWITHEHYDHLDPNAIDKVKRPATLYIADARSATQLEGNITVLNNGDIATVGGIAVKALPAYNIVRERAPGQKYHPKGAGNGYLATFGDFRLYIAGDTEAIPEMAELRGIDVAILPVMLPYTMAVDEAATAARAFRPRLVLPYHTDRTNASALVTELQGSGIDARVALPN